ncbi:hypothetical protein LTR64_003572 [Lithohypha guttulata]|uniref:uncharacterized protein n=1 Tax=Lithohypha guttulata TaxID=1690604 RepID=UPI00315D5F64
MNTGIQDANNLIWKLELALRDERKYDALLDTYNTERQPVGKRVGLSSLHNMRSHAAIMDVALGLSPGKSIEENQAKIAPAFDETHPDYAAKRDAIGRAQKVLGCEFKAPGAVVGWFYPSAGVNNGGGEFHTGQLRADGTLNPEFYVPSTIPGHFVPHAWSHKGNKRKPVFDLVGMSQLLLLARGSGWEELGDDRVRYEHVGDGGWDDVDEMWARQCGTGLLHGEDSEVA